MTSLTVLMLLALGAETRAEIHYPGASAVFQCKFDSSGDEDLYGWPPGWTRRHGPGFPRYVNPRVDDNRPPAGGHSLRVDLDGGAATAYGPSVAVNPDVFYVLEGYVETSGLKNDAAYLSLIFLDAKRTSITSEKISGTSPWQKIHVGPVSAPAGASSMLIGLHVEPQGEMQDLHGKASFGALWLGQLPRIVLTAQAARETKSEKEKPGRNSADGKRVPLHSSSDATFLLFPRGKPIEVACAVSGFPSPSYEVRLKLLDFEGRTLDEHEQSFNDSKPALQATPIQTKATPQRGNDSAVSLAARSVVSGISPQAKTAMPLPSPYARATWRLPGDAVGFYRVRATVVPTAPSVSSSPPSAETLQVELSFAVIEPQASPSGNEFGWSLGPNDPDLGLISLGDLLCQCGIGWVKFPFAIHEAAAPPAGDQSSGNSENGAKKQTPKLPAADPLEPLINFSDRLGNAGVSLAGVLQPPRVAGDAGKRSFDLLAAEVFARDPKTWYPSIEPVLARLADEIRFWQIGDDCDPGWVGCRGLPGIVSRAKSALDRIGQNMDVGIAWNLAAPLPAVPTGNGVDRSGNAKPPPSPAATSSRQKTPWRFLSLPCDDTMGNDELAQHLDNAKSDGVARWLVLAALPKEGHAARARVAHLVERMLTAKMHGAECIFISDPLDSDRGLIDRNGSPSELFLPWRTTALMLGGASYLGDIDLPQGNQIHCFGSQGRYVGVLAGKKPGRETVYLGTELQTHDLWGNSKACPPTIPRNEPPGDLAPAPQSSIAVEQLPIFLTRLDGPLTQWQLNVALSPTCLPSIPSALVPVALQLKNSFPQSIAGRVSIHGPQNWHIEPRTAEFRMEPGVAWKQPLDVVLPNDVVSGRQMIRLDFEIQADRLYRFTMYRPLEVTLGDVTFEGNTLLNSHGDLEVQQTLTNQGKTPASFRCNLLAPDRRRQSTEVVIQPAGKSQMTYRLPGGDQLLGKTIWLRAEEIDGPRVLNYRIETPATIDRATAPESPKQHQPSRPGSTLVL